MQNCKCKSLLLRFLSLFFSFFLAWHFFFFDFVFVCARFSFFFVCGRKNNNKRNLFSVIYERKISQSCINIVSLSILFGGHHHNNNKVIIIMNVYGPNLASFLFCFWFFRLNEEQGWLNYSPCANDLHSIIY